MNYVQLGTSELKVTEIAFGAWAIGGWMWGGADEAESVRALETAIEKGMTTIDTAPIYGFGLSEQLVGKVTRGRRDKVEILTKYGILWDTDLGYHYFSTRHNDGRKIDIRKHSGKESIIRECERSLQNLQTDYIDLYQMHWPDEETPIEESMEAIEQLLRQGKIRAAAVSNFSRTQLEAAHRILPIASNQVPYSMLKRDIEEELVPYCIEENIGIMVYSPLQRGILTGKIKPGHSFGEGDHRPDTPYYQPDNLQRTNEFLDKIAPLAGEKGVSLAQLVLRWTLQQPGITCILAGTRTVAQLEDNLGAAEFSLSDAELEMIDKHLSSLDLNLSA